MKNLGWFVPVLASFAALPQIAVSQPPPDEAPILKQYQRISPFWTNIPDCITTVNLHNNHGEDSLTVHPVLYLGDGSPVELAPVEMPPLGSAQIEVNETVRALGYTDDEFGGAVFRYEAETGGRLSVETAVAMPANNFLYSVESFTGFEKKSNAQHSAFWLPTSKTEVFYAAHNDSDQALTLRPKLQLWDQVFELDPVEMAPKGFTKLRITAAELAGYVGQTGRSGESVIGGVTLEHDGPPKAVYAVGWLDDADNGYSNMMSFADPAGAKGQTLYGVQLFLGAQPGLAGPGKPLDMRTHAVLRNMSDGAVAVSASASFTRGNLVQSVPLSPITLASRAVGEYDLDALQNEGVIPRDVSEVLLEAEYFAAPGSLMGRAYSISSDLTYGLYSVLESDGTGFFSGVHWSMQGDDNTVFTIANIGDKDESVSLELAVPGGTVDLPAFTLQPNQTRTVNMRRDLHRMLQSDNKVLPPQAVAGGFRVRSVDDPLRAELVVKEHVLSASKGTAAPFYGSCNYVTNIFLSAPTLPVQVPLGGTTDVYPMCNWNVGGSSGDDSALLQPDGGNEISISPIFFGFTRTISGLNVGSRTMLMDSDVPTESDPCGSQTVFASPSPQAQVNCPIPTGETTTSIGWADSSGQQAVHFFRQQLTPTGTSFANRIVSESDASPATDGCWFPGSAQPPVSGVSGGSWSVGSDNRWGDDAVGWTIGDFGYYQQERQARNLPLPCEADLFQELKITCPGTSSSVYRPLVLLRAIISATGASSERSGVLKGRSLVVQ